MVTAEESASGQSMTLPVGETLELRLPENPTTGYRWSVVENGADVLTPVEEQRGAPADGPGAPATHRWLFRAERAGRTTIELVHHRPWEDTAGATRRFTLEVEVPGS